jgi:hypothetical protein
MHVHLRVQREETGQGGHQLIHAECVRRADAQIDCRLAGSNLRLRLLEAVENLVAGQEKALAFIGQTLRARRTMQQLHAEPALQAVDALADERLAHAEKVRRRGEASRFHHRLEDAHFEQSFVFHLGNPFAATRRSDARQIIANSARARHGTRMVSLPGTIFLTLLDFGQQNSPSRHSWPTDLVLIRPQSAR